MRSRGHSRVHEVLCNWHSHMSSNRQDGEGSIRLLINVVNNQFSIEFNKTSKKHTSQRNGNQRLLHKLIQNSNHSRLRESVDSSPSRQNNPNEKCHPRTAAFASISSVPDRILQNPNEHIQEYVAELVFNLNEVSIQDWEDRKTREMIRPRTMRGRTTHPGISRTVKHISVIACVSAARKSFTPHIIRSQDSTSVWEQFTKYGLRLGADFVLTSNRKMDISM
jgi:hypothetical protein